MNHVMKERIRRGLYAFHDEYWKDVSEDAKNVCCQADVFVQAPSKASNVIHMFGALCPAGPRPADDESPRSPDCPRLAQQSLGDWQGRPGMSGHAVSLLLPRRFFFFTNNVQECGR